MQRNHDPENWEHAHREAQRHLGDLQEHLAKGAVAAYSLTQPWVSPCALGEYHKVNGRWCVVTLIYGSWKHDERHIRITTKIPGSLTPEDDELEQLSAASSGVVLPFKVAGCYEMIDGEVYQIGERWSAAVSLGALDIVINGFAAAVPSAVHIERLANLSAAVEARARHIGRSSL